MIRSFDTFAFDDEELELTGDGGRVPLEPRVAELLAHLIQRSPHLVTKEEMIAQLWGGLAVSESSLTRCVSALRSALGDSRSDARIIETVHGRGYRFRAEVRTVGAGTRGGATAPPHDLPFVGRVDARQQIDTAISQAIAGRGGLVFLAGEAGIGKTRTAEQAAATAEESGAVVRIGRCREEHGAPALWPWVQILRQEMQDLSAARLREWGDDGARNLTRLLPELERSLGGEPPQPIPQLEGSDSRFQLFDGVWCWLRRMADEVPRVLIFDDLHRADPSSLALLDFVVAEIHEAPILVIGTFREAEMEWSGKGPVQAADLLRRGSARLITLEGLSGSEIVELASAYGHDGLTGDQGERLRSYTGGNPFFLRYLLPELAAGSSSGKGDGLPKPPQSIRSALRAEIRRLTPGSQRLLEVASVVGREFDVGLVAEISERDAEDVLEALRPMLQSSLIEPRSGGETAYRFVHELVRESIYEDLSPLDRARLHLRTGDALEKRHKRDPEPHLSRLAHHFLQAEALVDPARAGRVARAAGDHAQQQMAYAEAADIYRRGLALLEQTGSDASLRCELLIALAEAHARSGERGAASENGWRAAELARAIDSPTCLARAALAVSPGFFALEIGIHDVELVSLIESALAALEPQAPSDWVLRARLLGRLALSLYWSGRVDRIKQAARAAEEAAAKANDPVATGQSLITRYAAIAEPGRAAERLELASRLVDHGGQAEASEQVLIGRVLGMSSMLELGRLSDFDQELLRFETTVRRFHHPQCAWYGPMYSGMRALMRGEFAKAQELTQSYLALGIRMQDNNVLHCFAAHTLVSRLETDLDDSAIADARGHSDSHPEYPTWKAGLTWGCGEHGRADLADPLLDEMVLQVVDDLPRDINWLNTVTLLAYAAWHVRAERHAKKLLDLLEPHADEIVTAGFGMAYFGCAEGYLARLWSLQGDDDRALYHAGRALQRERSLGARPWVVRTQESQADFFARLGRYDEARAVACSALETADALGMAQVGRRLRDKLAP